MNDTSIIGMNQITYPRLLMHGSKHVEIIVDINNPSMFLSMIGSLLYGKVNLFYNIVMISNQSYDTLIVGRLAPNNMHFEHFHD